MTDGTIRFVVTLDTNSFDALVNAVAARVHVDDDHDVSPWLNGDKEAAEYLRWPLGRVQKLSAAGVLPAHRPNGPRSRKVYHRDELDQVMRPDGEPLAPARRVSRSFPRQCNGA
jgi:excisionase family DNA binding protein